MVCLLYSPALLLFAGMLLAVSGGRFHRSSSSSILHSHVFHVLVHRSSLWLLTFLSKIILFASLSPKFPSNLRLLGKSLCCKHSCLCLPILILVESLQASICTSTRLSSSPWCRCWSWKQVYLYVSNLRLPILNNSSWPCLITSSMNSVLFWFTLCAHSCPFRVTFSLALASFHPVTVRHLRKQDMGRRHTLSLNSTPHACTHS